MSINFSDHIVPELLVIEGSGCVDLIWNTDHILLLKEFKLGTYYILPESSFKRFLDQPDCEDFDNS